MTCQRQLITTAAGGWSEPPVSAPGGGKPSPTVTGQMRDGYEVVEYPDGSGNWWWRDPNTGTGMNGHNEFRPARFRFGFIAILLILSAVAIVDPVIQLYLQI